MRDLFQQSLVCHDCCWSRGAHEATPAELQSQCACAGEGKQVMHIGDPHAADREVRQIDSPTSSADENDAVASLPAHWSKSGYMVSSCNIIAIDLGGANLRHGRLHDGICPGHMGISLQRLLMACHQLLQAHSCK